MGQLARLLIGSRTLWWRSKYPVARPFTALRRVMGLLLQERGWRKSEALPSAPRGIRSICPTSEAAEPRGAREALVPWQVATLLLKARSRSAADTVRDRCRKKVASDLNACAGSEVALKE